MSANLPVSTSSPTAAPRAREIRYAQIVGAVALMAGLAMVFIVFRLQRLVDAKGDPYHYGEIARGLAEHGLTRLTRRALSLYPEFIAVVYRLGGGDLAMDLIQCVFHVGTCLLAFDLGRRFYNARAGLLAGLFCALHPMLLRYVADLHMETMLTFLCTFTVWCAVQFHLQPNVPRGIRLGAVGMITTLTKGVMLPYLALFAAISFVLALRQRSMRTVAAVLAMVVTMGLLLAPWTYRNYRVSGGKFVLLTPGTSDSFLRGYIFTRTEFATLQKPPYTDAENESNEWFRRIAREAGTVWDRDEIVDEANNARVARQMILTRPGDTIRKCVVGLFTFWYEMTSLKNSLVPGVLALVGWVFAIVGLRRVDHPGAPPWLLWLPIVVMNVFVAALIPLGRYSVPILPCLMILAAGGVEVLARRRV